MNYAFWIRFFIANVRLERFPSWAILTCFLNWRKTIFIADIVTKGFPKVQKNRRGPIMKKNHMMIAELNLHVTSVHEGRKPLICEVCGWRSSRKGDLTKHITNLLFMQERNHSNIQIVVTDLEIWVLWKDLHILGEYQKYCNTSYDQN